MYLCEIKWIKYCLNQPFRAQVRATITAAALPRHQEKKETDKTKQAQIQQTYKQQ